MKKIRKLHKWNVRQKNILKTIEAQLKANHIITMEEINKGFLKERYGGQQRMEIELEYKLDEILKIIKKDIILH